MIKKYFFFRLVVLIGIFFWSGLSQGGVQAAETNPVLSLGCFPEGIEISDQATFVQTSGTITTIVCEVSSATADTELSVFVLGEQMLDSVTVASSGGDAFLKGEEPGDVMLSFPAVFQAGKYQYTFSVMSKETGEVLLTKAAFSGVIEENALSAKIAAVTFDKEQYLWQAPAELTVNTTLLAGQILQPDMLSLRVVMEDTTGNECAVLVDNAPVVGAVERLSIVFPPEGQCTNAVRIVVQDKSGTVLDQKIVAINFPIKSERFGMNQGSLPEGIFGDVPFFLQAGLVGTIILLLALGGYFMMRRKKPRNF